jgi:hypothetical protein
MRRLAASRTFPGICMRTVPTPRTPSTSRNLRGRRNRPSAARPSERGRPLADNARRRPKGPRRRIFSAPMHNQVVVPGPVAWLEEGDGGMAKENPKGGDKPDVSDARQAYERSASELDAMETKVKLIRARKRAADARRIGATSRAMAGAALEILGPGMARRGFDLRGLRDLMQDIETAELDLQEVRRRVFFRDQASGEPVSVAGETVAADVALPSAEPEVDSDNEGN